MKLPRRSTRAVLTILMIAAAVLPAAALAGGNSYPTTFTKFKYELKNGESSFKGQIGSPKGNCIKDRKVVLYRKKSGDKKKLGGDRTNNKGKFEIGLGGAVPKNGTYFAAVNKAKIGDSNDKNTCLSRQSPKLKLSS